MTIWENAQGVRIVAASDDPRITRAVTFIADHLDGPIHLDLEAVAAFAGAEYKYFSRLFHRKTGWLFGELVEHLRVTRARELLTTALSVAGIAARVGYRDLGTFERAFRRQTGQSPRSYRAAIRAASSNPARE